VEVIDTGEPVARQLQRRLKAADRLNPGPGPGTIDYFSSGNAAAVAAVMREIMAAPSLVVFENPL
jgi:hypothetical protein